MPGKKNREGRRDFNPLSMLGIATVVVLLTVVLIVVIAMVAGTSSSELQDVAYPGPSSVVSQEPRDRIVETAVEVVREVEVPVIQNVEVVREVEVPVIQNVVVTEREEVPVVQTVVVREVVVVTATPSPSTNTP